MIEPEPDPDGRIHDRVIRIEERQLMVLNRLKSVEENLETNRKNILKIMWVMVLSLAATVMHLFGIDSIWQFFRGK